MNSYGAMARDHWTRWRPSQLAQITDPETFFTRLGETVEADIDQMATDLAGPDPAGEDYLKKLGRLRMSRFTAESIVLRDQVLLPPENPESLEDLQAQEPDDPRTPPEAPWLPVREPAPSHQQGHADPA